MSRLMLRTFPSNVTDVNREERGSKNEKNKKRKILGT